jgi:hypothetical protein
MMKFRSFGITRMRIPAMSEIKGVRLKCRFMGDPWVVVG